MQGDLLVLNDSRVIPARLYARRTLRREKEKPTGRIEVMLTESAGENRWHALVRPGRKVAIGERLVFPAPDGSIALEAEVIERGQFGDRLLEFTPVDDFLGTLERIGHVPLPPYIHRDDSLTPIANDTRPSSRANVDRSPPPPPACTSHLRHERDRSPPANRVSKSRASRSTSASAPLRLCVSNASRTFASTASATPSPPTQPKPWNRARSESFAES